MSWLNGVCNRTGPYRPPTGGYDDEGQPLPGPERTIRVHEQPSSGHVRSSTGADVEVETYVLTTDAGIEVDGVYKGKPVRRVQAVVEAHTGNTIGSEFYL